MPYSGGCLWWYVIIWVNGSIRGILPYRNPLQRHVNVAWMTPIAHLCLELWRILTKNAPISGCVLVTLQRPLHFICLYDATSDAAIRCIIAGAILTRVETGNMHNPTDLPSHGVRKTRFFPPSPVRTPMIYPSISISWIAWHSSYMLVCVYVHGDFGVRSYVSSTHQKSLFFLSHLDIFFTKI